MKSDLDRLYPELKGLAEGFERDVYLGHSSNLECVIEPERWNAYYARWCRLIELGPQNRKRAMETVENILATYVPTECRTFCDGPLNLKRP